ncbi:MAG: Ribonuclease T2 precursor (RNase T2) [Thelocarpon superellum]|nr:MAG: Ribonuclease T2 precursor (RNase T2) [Thelocarpon superellum]
MSDHMGETRVVGWIARALLGSKLYHGTAAILSGEVNAMPSRLPSPGALAKFALGSAQIALLQPYVGVKGGASAACPNPQTQFWDANPSTGPSDSWTIHGLWPDRCDGSFEQYCDSSRQYTDISGIVQSAGNQNLLELMNTYWKDVNGNDESFWEHEWGKHGTCISTLDTGCYTDYAPHEELLDFLNTTVTLFQHLDTYQTLANAGIVPSTTATYTLAEIQDAISSVRGYAVTLGCQRGQLNEVWYHFNVMGSVQTGTFLPTSPDGSKSTCPSTGIKYLPKSQNAGTR